MTDENLSRKIIHCDCDCFFAAVAMRDNPALAKVPLAVGGGGRRGVVATCNYQARAFGVRSAMPMGEALRLCPALKVVPPDMARYRQVSGEIQAIFRALTPWVEPLSLDEAFLDVSDCTAWQGSATRMAQALKQQVRAATGITISAGVAPNKFLAKIASDWRKPDGLFVITPAQVAAFVRDLPVERLHGVGQVTAGRLHQMGIVTCADLSALPLQTLTTQFGRYGIQLHQMAQGEDDRPVRVSREVKSISVEQTFEYNLPNLAACLEVLPSLCADLQRRLLRRQGDRLVQKLFMKLRFADFSTHTLERTLPLSQTPVVGDFEPLLARLYGDGQRAVRLMGLGVRLRPEEMPSQQLELFPRV